jgi:hypothetical protein
MTEQQQQTGFSVEDYKRKIAGLLAKAEATDNEAEQKAFSEKAERLMIKLGIARAELEGAGQAQAEDIVEEHRDWRTIYAPAMGQFAYRVGLGFGDLEFLQSRYGKDRVRTYVIGHKGDVERYLTLVDSLHLQVFAALKAFRRENRDERRLYTIHENFVTDRSFIQGYAGAVHRRLREMRSEEVAEATPGAALVLASKAERVEAWKDERYPDLRKGRATSQQYSARGASAGAAAGREANLGGKAVGTGSKGALR